MTDEMSKIWWVRKLASNTFLLSISKNSSSGILGNKLHTSNAIRILFFGISLFLNSYN